LKILLLSIQVAIKFPLGEAVFYILLTGTKLMKRWTFLAACLFGLLLITTSSTQAAPFYYNVDQVMLPGGPIQLIPVSSNFSSNQWTLVANAKNNGLTAVDDLRFLLQFIYRPAPNPNTAFTFNDGTDTWSNAGNTISVNNASGYMTMSDTNAPLSFTNGALATLGSTDTIPYFQIGTLSAGATQSFTMILDVDSNFTYTLNGTFVVPEPSTLFVVGAGMLAAVACAFRRRV
jgi:hypothetical protein